MTAQIKVKVQRKAIVKLKVLPRFPSNVVGGSGFIITRSGTTYTFSIDPTTLPAGVGNVVGPPSTASDNAIARFDGTTGRAIKNSTVLIDDSGNVAAGTATFYNGVAAAPGKALLTLSGGAYIANGGTLSGDFPAFGNEPGDVPMTRAGTLMFTTVTDATLGASQALTAQAQFEASATSLASGGAAEFGAINNTNSANWDGYGTLHILKTPVGATHPRGTAMWSLLRGGEVNTTSGDSVGIAGIGTTNEAGHDSNVTFNTTTEAVHWVGHGLIAGKKIQFSLSGGTLPTPLVVDTDYFVKTVLGVDDFTLSATNGGALINLGGSPAATVVAHAMQNADRGLFIGNSTQWNSYITGLIIGGARDYGVRVGSGDGSAVNSIPTWPYSFFNAAGNKLFSVSSTGAIVSPSINGLTITASSGTLTVDTNKTFIVSNTMQLLSNDGAAISFGSGGTVAYVTALTVKNYLLNPSGMINQLGVGSQTDVTYDFDQWLTLTQTAAVTVSQLTLVEDTTPFMMRSLQAQASAQRFGRIQWMTAGACRDLRSQSVTLSARVRCSASTTLRYAVIEWLGTADTITKDIVNDWTSGTFTTGNFFTSTTTNLSGAGSIALTANTLTSITALTAAVSNAMNNLAVFFWTDSTQAQNVTLDIGKVKLEKNSVATTFVPDSFDKQLYDCEFHTKKSYNYAIAPGTNLGAAPSGSIYFNNGGTIAGVTVPFGRHMFKVPTVTVYDSIGGSAVVSTYNGSVWANGQTFNSIINGDHSFSGYASAQGVNFEYVAIARL